MIAMCAGLVYISEGFAFVFFLVSLRMNTTCIELLIWLYSQICLLNGEFFKRDFKRTENDFIWIE
jgi:hypothetical protein